MMFRLFEARHARAWMALILLIAFIAAPAAAQSAPREARVPGGVAHVAIQADGRTPLRAEFAGRRVPLVRQGEHWVALVGLPLALEPGRHELTVTLQGSDGPTTVTRGFEVTDKDYPEQRITLENERHVNPYANDLKRIRRENRRLGQALAQWTDHPAFATELQLPVEGILSSPFGLKRFFNDQPRSPHKGLDIAAPEGTPIVAPADGTVADLGDFFFTGNTLVIDHGQGLMTLYAHMHEVDVAPGDRVARGERIGTVGSTGRATGAHLHWGVSLNNARVDPTLFLPEETALQLAEQ